MCQILGRVDIWKGAHGSVGEREVCKPVIGTQPDKNHNETGKSTWKPSRYLAQTQSD